MSSTFSVDLPYRDAHGIAKTIGLDHPFGNTFITGQSGWGQSSLLRYILDAHIAQGFGICLFEDQYGQLTEEAYASLQRHRQVYLDRYGRLPEFIRLNLEELDQPINLMPESDIRTLQSTSDYAFRLLQRGSQMNRGRNLKDDPDYRKQSDLLTAMIWYLKQWVKHPSLALVKSDEWFGPTGCDLYNLIRFLEAPTEQVIASLRSLPDEEVHWFLDQFPPAELGDRISTLQANNHYLLHSLRAVSPDQGDFDLAVNRLEVPRIVCVGYWGGASFPTRMVGSLLVDSIYTQSNPDLSGDNTPRIPCAFLLDQRLEHHLQPTFFCSPKNKEAQADYQIAVYCGGPNLFRLKSGMGRVQLQRFLEGFSQVILGKLDLFTLGEMESLMTDLDVLGLPMPSQVIGRTDGATYAGDEHPFWILKKPAGEGGWHVSTGSFSNALPYIEDKPAPKWAGNYSRQASWPGELWRSLPGYLRQRLWRLLSSVAGWK